MLPASLGVDVQLFLHGRDLAIASFNRDPLGNLFHRSNVSRTSGFRAVPAIALPVLRDRLSPAPDALPDLGEREPFDFEEAASLVPVDRCASLTRCALPTLARGFLLHTRVAPPPGASREQRAAGMPEPLPGGYRAPAPGG